MRLSDLLVETCSNAVDNVQRSDGSFPAGHNGPYNDPETPVRNTSHWVILLCEAYEITQNKKYKNAVLQAVAYLESIDARPYGETFHHRSIEGKDRCNGLIGQAWTIEALATAGNTLDLDNAIQTACTIFKSHPFIESLGLWQRVEIDGSILTLDRTFNHQLWFAAAGGLLKDADPEIDKQIKKFIKRLPDNLRTYSSGLIYHPLCPMDSLLTYLKYVTDRRKLPLYRSLGVHLFRPPKSRAKIKNKAIGYHAFNAYAFALLYEQYPEKDVWTQTPVTDTIAYLTSDGYLNSIETSAYGYPYNPPGFEVPYALEVFGIDAESVTESLLETQFRNAQLGKDVVFPDAPDPQTSTARLYEATRMSDREISQYIPDT